MEENDSPWRYVTLDALGNPRLKRHTYSRSSEIVATVTQGSGSGDMVSWKNRMITKAVLSLMVAWGDLPHEPGGRRQHD